MRNGKPLKIAVRKEIRSLTDNERIRYNNVLRQLKNNGEFDKFNDYHRQVCK